MALIISFVGSMIFFLCSCHKIQVYPVFEMKRPFSFLVVTKEES